jgi:hypothetical protein
MPTMRMAKYLLFSIVIFGYLIFAQYLIGAIKNFEATHLTISYHYMVVPIFIILGFMLGLDHLIDHVIKKEGKLHYDCYGLFLTIPSLFFAAYIAIIFIKPLAFLLVLYRPFMPFIISQEPFIAVVSTVLGYSIINSLKRE